MKNNHTFSFGPFILDNTDKELRYGGDLIYLSVQQFELLLFLVQNPKRLLTKEEIQDKVWEGRFVEEGNLPRVIHELREKLGNYGREYIRTAPKHGYRFEAEVSERQPEIPAEKCPWFGLRAFDVTQAQYFHGRDNEVREMLNMLGTNNFLAVVGSSGTGKSSLVRAGLIPALRSGEFGGGHHWIILLFRPGSSPLKQLAEQLLRAEERPANVEEVEALANKLRASPDALSEVLFSQQGDRRNLRAIIVVDQFEELITQCSDTDERRKFVDCLLVAASAPERRAFVVITVRTDFYPKLEGHERLWERITRYQYGVKHLGREQLRQVIKEPAAFVDLEVEEALVGEILDDLGEGPGALPLLSHAMTELFKRREGRKLTFEAYRSLGKIKETITNHANAVFEQFGPDEQALARLILIKLVKVGEEPEYDVRQQVPITDLVENPERLPAVESVVSKLSQERLLTTWATDSAALSSAPSSAQIVVVELTHEALIRHWQRLSDWLKEKRRARRLFIGLDISARDWKESSRDPGFLYRGNRLANTLDARAEYEEFIGPLHREFLTASSNLDQQEKRKRERETQREDIRRRLRQRYKALAVITIALASLAIIALWKWVEAGQQRDLARANGWAGASISQLSFDPELSLLLASEAGQLALTPETTRSLRQSLSASYVQATLPAHQLPVISVAVSQDGKFLLTGGADEARLWDLKTKKVLRTLGGHKDWITWAAPNSDWSLAVTASRDKTARVWDLASGAMITELRGHTDEVNHAVFSPDGTKILTASEDNTARIWDARTGQTLKLLTGHQKWINTTVYSPDGKLCVTASGDKTARVWDTQTGATVGTLVGHKGTVISAAFSPDGKQIITSSSDKTVRLWALGTWQEVNQFHGHRSNVNSVEFSHDGKWILTASKDGTARLWNAKNGFPLIDFRGHFSGVNTAVFSPDDTHVYTASGDHTARVWEVRFLPVAVNLAGHKDAVMHAAFSPDGEQIVTASLDKTAILWHAKTGKILKVFLHASAVHDADYNPNAGQIATSSSDGKVRLWNVETGTMLKEFLGHTGTVHTVSFSHDGAKLVTASEDQTARVWEVSSGRLLMQLNEHTKAVYQASFSPDSQRIATASDDHKVRVWNAASGKAEVEWDVGTGKLNSVRFSFDGKYLVASCSDQTARIWNLDNRAIIAVLRGHEDALNYAEFSPNGELVITAGADQTTRLWDFGTGTTLFQLPNALDAPVTQASFSPDGKSIVTADKMGGVTVYACELCGASRAELLALARKRKVRELTAAERARYLTAGDQKF